MNDKPVLASEAEHTTPVQLENALHVLRKTIREIDEMTPGVEKATVVSSLYRALQELTKEMREKREFALLDAAIELAQESWGGKRSEVRFFPDEDTPDEDTFAFGLEDGIRNLCRVNKWIVMDLPNGKRQILEPFSSDSEPGRIAVRTWRKVFKTLRFQRDWAEQHRKPYPRPRYQRYENR